jgi:hypothetical protein
VPAKKVKINFEGVDPEIRKGGGGGKRIPEGDYLVKILEAEYVKPNRDEGKAGGYRWTCQVAKGPHKGVRLRGFTSFKPEALWSLRNLIFAATGKNVAGKAMNIDPEKMYGKIVGAAVEDNEYTKDEKTKITSQINTFFHKDEFEESEDEEDVEDDEEEEDEEEEDDEDLEDVEVEDL